jgi:hypothetical protein
MSIVLKDGSGGGGYEAKVDRDNKLYTHSTVFPNEHDQSLKGSTYYAHTADTADSLTVTTTGGPMLYLKNTSTTQNLSISEIEVGCDQVATILKINRNPTLGTIGNENTHTPVNLNTGSSKTANVTAYNWDEVGNGMTGLSGGTTFATFLLGAGLNLLSTEEALIVAPGTSIYFNLQATGSTSETTLTVRFHYEDID